MLNVPKKANDALHLSMLEGCDVRIDTLGDVVLQDSFTVWDPKQLIRKGRDRHIFLFELYLLFSKEVKDSAGKVGKSKIDMENDLEYIYAALIERDKTTQAVSIQSKRKRFLLSGTI